MDLENQTMQVPIVGNAIGPPRSTNRCVVFLSWILKFKGSVGRSRPSWQVVPAWAERMVAAALLLAEIAAKSKVLSCPCDSWQHAHQSLPCLIGEGEGAGGKRVKEEHIISGDSALRTVMTA